MAEAKLDMDQYVVVETHTKLSVALNLVRESSMKLRFERLKTGRGYARGRRRGGEEFADHLDEAIMMIARVADGVIADIEEDEEG